MEHIQPPEFNKDLYTNSTVCSISENNIELNEVSLLKKTSYQFLELPQKAFKYFFSSAPNNFAKAACIDLPNHYDLSSPNYYKATISFGAHSIRSTIRESLKETFHISNENVLYNNLVSLTSGFAGGAFKYYLTNQYTIVGMVNNAAYEICNNYEYCKNNDEFFTVVFESLDSLAQAGISIMTQNPDGFYMATSKLSIALIEGALTGMQVNFNAEYYYSPLVNKVSEIMGEILNGNMENIYLQHP